ncbi:hypothetical protein JK358_32780 [Nocardia sp. 2]|uniref:DUF559 domain-containing protein n=1 Tax=Nocardia acididurans TaxID=2802282 RepID=A0ABS1MG07_9NOCA|nr:hypothetical protein [Nocardia acididurans]MBL1079191.1 hypothetical protein [Nocardia acididurans]
MTALMVRDNGIPGSVAPVARRCGSAARYRGGASHRVRPEHAGYDNPIERHRLLIDGILPEMAAGKAVVSHQSAAVVYGTTLWRAPLERVCVTRDRHGGGRIRPQSKVHGSPVDSVVEMDGLLVTTPARTVVDLALTLPFDAAVVAGDALVGAFGLTREELARELEAARRRHGISQAKRVVAFLDGRSQSAGESLSRVLIRRLGLPVPRSQGNVLTPDGRFVGLVDLYYENAGVLCEFDGHTRYGRVLRAGESAADAVAREQTRENYLRALGFQVVRWTWEDLIGNEIGHRLCAALARGRRSRADGRIEPAPAAEPRRIRTRAL